MKLVDLKVEQIIGKYHTDGSIEKKEFDLDRYDVEMRTPMATHEFYIIIDHLEKQVFGDVVRYGSWDDLTKEEITEVLEVVKQENKLVRSYDSYTFIES